MRFIDGTYLDAVT